MNSSKTSKPQHWQSFIYFIVYPGILGSMFYSILQLEIFHYLWYLKLFILLLFCIDWFFLYSVLEKNAKLVNNTFFDSLFDLFIALVFGISFFQLSKGAIFIAYSLLLFNAVLMLIYTLMVKSRRKVKYILGFSALVLSCITLLSCSLRLIVDGTDIEKQLNMQNLFLGFLPVISYFTHVIYLLREKKRINGLV